MIEGNEFTLRTDTWPEMVQALSREGFEVDSAYRHRPEKHILAYKGGQSFHIEVTRYFEGDYEVQSENIREDDYDDIESCGGCDECDEDDLEEGSLVCL